MSSQSPQVTERSPSPGEGESTSPLALLARHPLSAYYLLMGSALLLLLLGLIMVMSASSIESVRIFGSPYTLAQRQNFFALLGVVAMFFAERTSVQFWRAFEWPLLLAAFGFLVAVLIIGVDGGDRGSLWCSNLPIYAKWAVRSTSPFEHLNFESCI